MTNKSSKICVLFLLCIIVISSGFTPVVNASGAGPTLTDLSPNRATAGQLVKVLGMSYSEGSEVAFYLGATEKARVAIAPIPPSFVTNSISSPLLPSLLSTDFTFTVPSLVPDLYTVRLEHTAILGASDPVPFAILPVVNSISPLSGNHLTRVEVVGTGFQKDERQNIARFLQGYDIVSGSATENAFQFRITSQPRLPIGTYEIRVFLKTGENLIEHSYAPSLKRNFVLHPHINAISPISGNTDSMIAIAGIHYSVNPSIIRISFYQGDKKLVEIQPEQAQMGGSLLLGRVPPSLAPGTYIIKVSVIDAMNSGKWIESDNSFNFTVTALPPPPPPTPQPEPVSEPQPEPYPEPQPEPYPDEETLTSE